MAIICHKLTVLSTANAATYSPLVDNNASVKF